MFLPSGKIASPQVHRANVLGFTLIEIISVIVILSILAALGGKFVVESTAAYRTANTRGQLVNTGRKAVERMTRQLRGALPNSLRITNSNMCIEFFPIAGGGGYLGPVPDVSNGAFASATINVSPHTLDFGAASFVSLGAASAAELYGVNPVSRATLSARTANSLTLSAAKTWQRNSVAQRFYLLGAPQAFCVVANQLRFYDNQNATTANVSLASSYSLLADSVASVSPFALTVASDNRNVNVQFNLNFVRNNESVALHQSVMVRNVP